MWNFTGSTGRPYLYVLTHSQCLPIGAQPRSSPLQESLKQEYGHGTKCKIIVIPKSYQILRSRSSVIASGARTSAFPSPAQLLDRHIIIIRRRIYEPPLPYIYIHIYMYLYRTIAHYLLILPFLSTRCGHVTMTRRSTIVTWRSLSQSLSQNILHHVAIGRQSVRPYKVAGVQKALR